MTAAYLIIAVLVVPAFGDLGIAAIAAHMIVYWFSQDSNITPPVCVAAFAGAAIAKADPWKTGWTAFKYAKMLYVMPVLLAFIPAMVLDATIPEIIMTFVGVIPGTIVFASAVQGYLNGPLTIGKRASLGIAMVLLFWPSWIASLLGVVIFGIIWWLNGLQISKDSTPNS